MASKKKKMLTAQISLDMQKEDSERLLHFLKCRECNELADEAVETNCCHVLLCSACLAKRDDVCPECEKKHTHAQPSHLARRMIGCQPLSCPSCGKETTRSERSDHDRVCPQQVRRCPAGSCDFSGFPDAFLEHLTMAHKEKLVREAASLFAARRPRGSRHPRFDSDSNESDSSTSSNDSTDVRRVLRTPRLRISRLTAVDPSRTTVRITGKNYCEGPLNGPSCNCCDGSCGPDNGCNCVDCMRRDLITFDVRTQRTLVNREGVISRISQETGQFYCGRPVMRHDPSTDGNCGPNNGNNCHACATLDDQISGRYAEIAAEWDDEDATNDLVDMSDPPDPPHRIRLLPLDSVD